MCRGSGEFSQKVSCARCRAMSFDFSTLCKCPEDYYNQFSPSNEARREMEYWANFTAGQSTLISPVGLQTKSVDTDASDASYGWFWKNSNFSEYFSKLWLDKRINVKELYALRQFIINNQDDLENCLLCWRVDNSAALAAIKK